MMAVVHMLHIQRCRFPMDSFRKSSQLCHLPDEFLSDSESSDHSRAAAPVHIPKVLLDNFQRSSRAGVKQAR
jgi:hypothetical protein